MRRLWENLPDDLQWGLSWGAGGALFFTVVALFLFGVQFLLTGQLPPSWADVWEGTGRHSMWWAIPAYWVGGVIAGVLLGWMRGFAGRSNWTAAFTGIVISFLMALMFAATGYGFTAWPRDAVIVAGIYALLAGPIFGVMLRKQYAGALWKDEDGRWHIDL